MKDGKTPDKPAPADKPVSHADGPTTIIQNCGNGENSSSEPLYDEIVYLYDDNMMKQIMPKVFSQDQPINQNASACAGCSGPCPLDMAYAQ